MKKIFFAFVLSGLFFTSRAQQADTLANIQFEMTEHDFGKIKEGTLATYDFNFTNTGHGTLLLSNVQASCGCTSPEWPKEAIAPGATSKIRAVYNSKARPGTFEKYIHVKSNAASGEVVLKIKGEVEPIPVEPKSPVRNQTMD